MNLVCNMQIPLNPVFLPLNTTLHKWLELYELIRIKLRWIAGALRVIILHRAPTIKSRKWPWRYFKMVGRCHHLFKILKRSEKLLIFGHFEMIYIRSRWCKKRKVSICNVALTAQPQFTQNVKHVNTNHSRFRIFLLNSSNCFECMYIHTKQRVSTDFQIELC